jgi:hypothetical protein
MGKKIKSREAQLRAAEGEIAARLRARSKDKAGPAFIGSYAEFAPAYREKIETFRGSALRAPEAWRCRLRSRSPERRFLELVRFTFARYRVARHLENAWIEETHAFADQVGVPVGANRAGEEGAAFRSWYILVAQGGSLYKHATQGFMSKLETHHFLTAPDELGTTQRAFWYAIARAQTGDMNVAVKVARTRLSAFPLGVPFWRDVARYFARNPTSIMEMNDLVDFIQAAHEADEHFSLSGRSLEGLRRRMGAWHRTLRRREIVCGGTWEGHALPDVDYEAGGEERRAIWRFRQIKTGNDLFKEGQRMHHCVVSYKFRCMSADISIWSLTCEYPLGKLNRGVTLELRNDGAIVQCRGFANRLPYANEVTVVKRWAAAHGLTWQAMER